MTRAALVIAVGIVLASCAPWTREQERQRHACGWGLALRLVTIGEAAPPDAMVVVLGDLDARGPIHARTLMRPVAGPRVDYVANVELWLEERDARGTLIAGPMPPGMRWDDPSLTMSAPQPFVLTHRREWSRIVVDPASGRAVEMRLCPIAAPLVCDLHTLLACDESE